MRQVALILIGLIAIQCVTLQSGASYIIKQLNDVSVEEGYGKQFMGLLQLKLEQGSKVEEVLQLITELLNSLKSDQANDDMEHSTEMAMYESNIETLSVTLEQMTIDLADNNNMLNTVGEQIESLLETIANIEMQLNILNGKEEELRSVQSQDEIAYNRRMVINNRVLQALNRIIDMLSQAVMDQTGRQDPTSMIEKRQAVLAQVHKDLGPNHPITTLITLTTQFDVPTVTRIVEKLVNIRDAIIASQIEDNNSWAASQTLFDTLIQQLNEVRNNLAQDLDEFRQNLKQLTNQKVMGERTRDQLNEDIPNTQSILQSTQSIMEQYHAGYSSRVVQRTSEIEIITQAYNLVKNEVQATKRSEALTASLGL